MVADTDIDKRTLIRVVEEEAGLINDHIYIHS